MFNIKHYPTHPGAEHPPTMMVQIPLEEYERLKGDIADLRDERKSSIAIIDELNAENKSALKAVSYWHDNYCELQKVVDRTQSKLECKQVKTRILKRALWLARAERAVAEQTVDEWSRYKEKHPCGSWRADPFEYWVQAWIYVEKLCRKKAEEYK